MTDKRLSLCCLSTETSALHDNILEQDHRFIKKITKPHMGFKAFHSASATIAGIEVAHMIRKSQFANDNRSPFEVFAELAA